MLCSLLLALLTSGAPAHATVNVAPVSMPPLLLGKVGDKNSPISARINAWAEDLLPYARFGKTAAAHVLIDRTTAEPTEPLHDIIGPTLALLLRRHYRYSYFIKKRDAQQHAAVARLTAALDDDPRPFAPTALAQLRAIAGKYPRGNQLLNDDNLLEPRGLVSVSPPLLDFGAPNLEVNHIAALRLGKDGVGNHYFAYPNGAPVEFRVNTSGFYSGTIRTALGRTQIGSYYIEAWTRGEWELLRKQSKSFGHRIHLWLGKTSRIMPDGSLHAHT